MSLKIINNQLAYGNSSSYQTIASLNRGTSLKTAKAAVREAGLYDATGRVSSDAKAIKAAIVAAGLSSKIA